MNARLLALAVLLVGCSDTQLRVVYEEPILYEQPDSLGPTQWADEFQQRTVEASDILFVVDDSCSMSDEQSELALNFDNFIQGFVGTNLDYHVGVVRAAIDGGDTQNWGVLEEVPGGGRWIDSSTPDPVAAFNTIANVGTGGGNCEMGLQAGFSALTLQGAPGYPNEGFYRENALLTMVVISDEPDRYDDFDPFAPGGSCGGIDPEEYINWWRFDLKGPTQADKLIWTGIVGDRPNGCGNGDDGAEAGDGYWEVIDAVGGNFLSICTADWSTFLTELGFEAAGLKTSFNLRRIPVLDTLVVTIDGAEPDPSTWSYDRTRNAIDFPLEHIPDELAIVRIEYTLLEDTGASVPVEGEEG